MIVTTELARQLADLEQRHAALLAALEALSMQLKKKAPYAVERRDWFASEVDTILRPHREGP